MKKKNKKKRKIKSIKKVRKMYCRYLFDTGMVILRKGTNFQKLFHRWYMSDSDIVPNRIYDFLKIEGIINNFYRKV